MQINTSLLKDNHYDVAMNGQLWEALIIAHGRGNTSPKPCLDEQELLDESGNDETFQRGKNFTQYLLMSLVALIFYNSLSALFWWRRGVNKCTVGVWV